MTGQLKGLATLKKQIKNDEDMLVKKNKILFLKKNFLR